MHDGHVTPSIHIHGRDQTLAGWPVRPSSKRDRHLVPIVTAVEKLSEDVSRKMRHTHTTITMYRPLADPKYRTRFPTTCTYVLARNLKYSGRCDGLVEAVIILGSDSTSQ